MSAFDLLTEKDYELIADWIEAYAPAPWPAPEYLKSTILKEWDTSKSVDLLRLFDNKLILRRPYTYTVQSETLFREIEDLMNISREYKQMKKFFADLTNDWVFNGAKNMSITEFYVPDFLQHLLSANVLSSNSWTKENCVVTFSDGETMKVFTGMKPMKIIHKFIQKYKGSEFMFEEFRIWHSMLLNQKYLDGELCLSIHPLDYMTMSDNGGHWSSCMRWTDGGGDYRAGTIECMNSPYIIVAYLHNPSKPFDYSESYDAPNKEWSWNNKKWRELFIINDSIINEIKGYPYQDENLTNTVLMWLKELAQDNLGWEYGNEEINVAKPFLCDDNGDEIALSYDAGVYMYNDIGTLSKHRARVNVNKLIDFGRKSHCFTEYQEKGKDTWRYFIDVPYGGSATCMNCGCYMERGEALAESVLCENCDDSYRCPCCGERMSPDFGYYVEECEGPICENCYENDCGIDTFTEESHFADNLIELALCVENANGSITKLETPDYVIVYDPQYNSEYKKYFTELPKKHWFNPYYCTAYVTLDMACDRKVILEAFGFNDEQEYLIALEEASAI